MNRIITDEQAEAIKKILDSLPEEKTEITTPTVSPVQSKFLMAVSPNYTGLFSITNTILDWLKQYKVNGLRVFGTNGWQDNPIYFPWTGYPNHKYTYLIPEYFEQVENFINRCNERNITVIFNMFQNNSGGGTEDITKVNGILLRPYMHKIAEMCKGKNVIIEALNEDNNSNFQNFVRNEMRAINPNLKFCFYNCNGAEYKIIHVSDKRYIGGNVIQSNDTPKAILGYSDNDYYNITKQAKEQGGSVEWLLAWGRTPQGFIGNNYSEMKRQYEAMLSKLSNLI